MKLLDALSASGIRSKGKRNTSESTGSDSVSQTSQNAEGVFEVSMTHLRRLLTQRDSSKLATEEPVPTEEVASDETSLSTDVSDVTTSDTTGNVKGGELENEDIDDKDIDTAAISSSSDNHNGLEAEDGSFELIPLSTHFENARLGNLFASGHDNIAATTTSFETSEDSRVGATRTTFMSAAMSDEGRLRKANTTTQVVNLSKAMTQSCVPRVRRSYFVLFVHEIISDLYVSPALNVSNATFVCVTVDEFQVRG